MTPPISVLFNSDCLFSIDTGFAFAQEAGQDSLVTGLLADKAKNEVKRRLTEVIKSVRMDMSSNNNNNNNMNGLGRSDDYLQLRSIKQ